MATEVSWKPENATAWPIQSRRNAGHRSGRVSMAARRASRPARPDHEAGALPPSSPASSPDSPPGGGRPGGGAGAAPLSPLDSSLDASLDGGISGGRPGDDSGSAVTD